MNFNAFKKLGLALTIAVFAFSGLANAETKTYTENEFLDNFSGKPKAKVMKVLGKPVKKQLGVRPSNASKITGKKLDNKKPVKVEMWYYNNIVKYDPKRTYKEVEITYVNGRVSEIAFFNNR